MTNLRRLLRLLLIWLCPRGISTSAKGPIEPRSGRSAALGTEFGKVRIIDTETGDLMTEIECRNRYGKHARGEKVKTNTREERKSLSGNRH